jgi:aspartyl-tRNA(Asn)/glutamyl-tRNA(Gln) amidotransferase subunit C
LIDKKTLLRIAEIARLKLGEQEQEEFQRELAQMLEFFSKINEIEAKGEELYYVREKANVLRKDSAKKSGRDEKIRALFTKQEDGCMIAPKSL